MAIECWLGLFMGSDGSSTLWEGSWVSPTVAIGVLAPKTTVGEKPRVHMFVVIDQSSPLPISIFPLPLSSILFFIY